MFEHTIIFDVKILFSLKFIIYEQIYFGIILKDFVDNFPGWINDENTSFVEEIFINWNYELLCG